MKYGNLKKNPGECENGQPTVTDNQPTISDMIEHIRLIIQKLILLKTVYFFVSHARMCASTFSISFTRKVSLNTNVSHALFFTVPGASSTVPLVFVSVVHIRCTIFNHVFCDEAATVT